MIQTGYFGDCLLLASIRLQGSVANFATGVKQIYAQILVVYAYIEELLPYE